MLLPKEQAVPARALLFIVANSTYTSITSRVLGLPSKTTQPLPFYIVLAVKDALNLSFGGIGPKDS
jgi:hypothetical protein